jgi:acetyl esterase/lipase
MRHLITLCVAALLSFGAVRPALAAAAVASDLQPDRLTLYRTIDGLELNLHTFEPSGLKPSDRRSAIVFFFGGGWSGGDAKQFYQHARALADQGMVAFSADYRVKSRNQTTPFAAVQDARAAIRWVRAHSAEWGIDPDRIVASGGSAGGHLAACTAVIVDGEKAVENAKFSSVPNALVLFNPVLDTTEKGYGAKNFKAEQQTTLSPCHHVRPDLVPTIIFHGTADKTVPFENAERFTRLMHAAGNTCVLVPFDGKDHGFFNAPFFRPSSNGTDYELTMQRTVEFLTMHRYLGDPR